MGETVDIKNVEFIRSGKWTDSVGKTVDLTPEMINSMFANSKKLGFRPPLKLGHSEQGEFQQSLKETTGIAFPSDGLPAIGNPIPEQVTTNADGTLSLMGTLERIPAKAVDLVKNHFRNRSAELLSVPDGKGGKIGPVFGGLALLGWTRPAIKQLAAAFSEVPEYTFKSDDCESTFLEASAETAGAMKNDFDSASPGGTGGDEQKPENHNTQLEEHMNGITIIGPDGKPVVLKTVEEVNAFAEKVRVEATKDMVKKTDYDALQQREAQRLEEARQARIQALFSEARKPVNGKALPPAVVDLFETAAKTFNPEGDTKVKFSEDGKETDLTLVEAIAKGLDLVRKTGLIEFKETTASGGTHAGASSKEKDLRDEYRANKAMLSHFSEDEYVQANL